MGNIDINQILQIEKITLIVIFAVAIALLLIFIVRGLFRGWRYGTYRLIYFTILIVVGLTCLGPIADGIGGINLGTWIQQDLTFTIDSKTISVPVTTIFETLKETITQLLHAFNPDIDPANAIALAIAMTTSLIKLLTIFIEGILLLTVFNLLGFLLWHIAFKHIIPKDVRKITYHKGRGWSALEEGVIGLVVICMVILPVTSVFSSIAQNINEPTTSEKKDQLKATNSTYNTISQVVDTYNDSILSKAFLSIKDTSGSSLDVNLMSFFTKTDYKDASISIIDELKSVSKIGSLAVEAGLLSQEGTTAQKTIDALTSEYTPLLIQAVGGSELVMSVMPLAMEIVTNMSAIKDKLAADWSIDYYGYNWAGTFENLGNILTDLQTSGVLGGLYDNDGTLSFNTTDLSSYFGDNFDTSMNNIFDALSDSSFQVLHDLLLSYLATLYVNPTAEDETTLSLADFLPAGLDFEVKTDETTGKNIPTVCPDAFSKIDFVKEIKYIYTSFKRLYKVDSQFIGLALNGLLSNSFDTKALTDLVIDNADAVSPIITGVKSDGTFEFNDDGTAKTDGCLLDCSLIVNAMPKFFTILQNTVNTSMNASVDLTAAKNEIFGETSSTYTSAVKMKNIKYEVNSLLKVVTTFTDTEAGKNFLKNLDSMPGIVYNPDGSFHSVDSTLLQALIDSMVALDDSKIASSIMPAIFDSYLGGTEGPLSSLGLTSLNFYCDNLGTELSKLLTMYKDCGPLIAYLQNLATDSASITTSLAGLQEYCEVPSGSTSSPMLLVLLNDAASSKIINPTKDKSGNDITNQNYLGLINKMLKSFLGDDYTYTGAAASLDTTQENHAFVSFIDNVLQSNVLSLVSAGSSLDFSTLSSISFESLLGCVGQSSILSDVFARYLDGAILPALSSTTTTGVSFANVTDWSKEGKALDALVNYVSEIGDLANIDFLGSDPEAIAGIVKCLASSQIFGTGDDYAFGSFFYDKFTSSLGDSTLAYFTDPDTTGTTIAEKTTDLKANFLALDADGWSEEADVFGSIIRYLERVGGIDSFGSGTADLSKINPNDIRLLLEEICNSRSFGQSVTFHLYATLAGLFKSAGLDIGTNNDQYGNANPYYAYNLFKSYSDSNKQLLIKEADKISDILTAALSSPYGLLDKTGQISSSNADLTKASPNFLLKPILDNMATSYLFNTLPDGATATSATAFESEMASLLANASVYSSSDAALTQIEKVGSGGSKYAGKETTQARLNAFSGEVNKLIHVTECLQVVLGDGLDFENFNLAAYFSDAASDEEALVRRQNLVNLLDSINSSAMLYPAIPSKLRLAFDTAGDSLGNLNLTNANTDYNSGEAYGEDEIDTISWILYDAGRSNLSFSNLLTMNTSNMVDLLSMMASSHVFNSLPSGTTGLTVFQEALSKTLHEGQFQGLYFESHSPKDDATINTGITYTNAETKATYSVQQLFPTIEVSQKASDYRDTYCGIIKEEFNDGSSVSLETLLNDVKDKIGSDGLNNLATGSLSSIDGTALGTILKDLNDNKLLYDCVPNAIFQFANGSSLDTLKNAGFDLSVSNAFYPYWYNSGSMSTMTAANATFDFAHRYADSELDSLSSLVKEISNNQTLFSDTTSITKSSLTTIRSLLMNMEESMIFHGAGAYLGVGVTSTSQSEINTDATAGLTVFEQSMFNLYNKSGLATRAYSDTYDILIYDPNNIHTTLSNGALRKLRANIVNLSNGTSGLSHTGNWAGEIKALLGDGSTTNGLLGDAFDKLFGSEDTGIDMSSLDFTSPSLSTATLQTLALDINSLDLAKDIVPYELNNFLVTSFGFDKYSKLTTTFDCGTLASGTSYVTKDELGMVGPISSLTITGNGSYELSYGYDGTVYSTPETIEVTGGSSTKNYPTLLPNYLIVKNVGASDTTTSLTMSYNTANFFLSQSQYADSTEDGPIGSIMYFAGTMKKEDNTYFSFGSGSSMADLVNSHLSTKGILQLISASKGFYTANKYNDDYITKGVTTASFCSRDVTLDSFLKFSYTQSGTTITANLARYLEEDYTLPYKGIASLFTNGFSSSNEGTWLDANLQKILTIEVSLGESISSHDYDFQGATVHVPALQMKMESLYQDSNSTFKNFVSDNKASTLSLATGFANGTYKNLLKQQIEYGKSTYFTGIFTVDDGSVRLYPFAPNSQTTRKDAVNAADVTGTHGLSSTSLLSDSDVSALEEMLSIGKVMSVVSTYTGVNLTSQQISDLKTALQALDAYTGDSKMIINYFYSGTLYDCFVNRSFFKTNRPSAGLENKVDYPNPWATGFSYTTVSNTVA